MKILFKTILFTILLPGTVAVLIPYLLLASAGGPHFGHFWFVGATLIALGTVAYCRCAWDFAFKGQGTPAAWDAPKAFVSAGLYRIVRNPMYLAGALMLIGEAIMFASLRLLAYAFLVWMMYHLFLVYYEEPTLKKTFGAAYEEYAGAVPRWIPRFSHSR